MAMAMAMYEVDSDYSQNRSTSLGYLECHGL